MPIRPENLARYARDWPAISLGIRRDRAGWRCEWIDAGERCRARHREPHPDTGARVVLTCAHLNHQPEDNDPTNLLALCQLHHNRYDAPMRAAGIQRRAREALACGDLFAVTA